jgi:hypothetical protein
MRRADWVGGEIGGPSGGHSVCYECIDGTYESPMIAPSLD